MTERSKGERVWVAVLRKNGRPFADTVGSTRRAVEFWLDNKLPPDMAARFTIRRATLIVDPVKPKRRRQP